MMNFASLLFLLQTTKPSKLFSMKRWLIPFVAAKPTSCQVEINSVACKDVEATKAAIWPIEKLCNNYGLVDSWREQHPHKTPFTSRNSSGKIRCRLDFWLIPKRLLGRVTKIDVCAYYDSDDHSLVTISFRPEGKLEKKRSRLTN